MTSSLSSHVLDTTLGRPAQAMKLILTSPDGNQVTASTNEDGRCNDWGNMTFEAGIYQLRFLTGDYLQQHHQSAFYPHVDICFEIAEGASHYHIPLLISPFGFSSYRGS
jgi:5-hydroxyisourate hydrolase